MWKMFCHSGRANSIKTNLQTCNLWTGICVKYFLSFPHQKKLRQTPCLLFNFWMMKLTKTPIFPNCQVPNGYFLFIVNFVIKELKFCKIVQLFLCQLLWWVRGNLREQEKIKTQKRDLCQFQSRGNGLGAFDLQYNNSQVCLCHQLSYRYRGTVLHSSKGIFESGPFWISKKWVLTKRLCAQ